MRWQANTSTMATQPHSSESSKIKRPSEDHASLPSLSILPTVGQLGHDDPGLLKVFVWSLDSVGPLGDLVTPRIDDRPHRFSFFFCLLL